MKSLYLLALWLFMSCCNAAEPARFPINVKHYQTSIPIQNSNQLALANKKLGILIEPENQQVIPFNCESELAPPQICTSKAFTIGDTLIQALPKQQYKVSFDDQEIFITGKLVLHNEERALFFGGGDTLTIVKDKEVIVPRPGKRGTEIWLACDGKCLIAQAKWIDGTYFFKDLTEDIPKAQLIPDVQFLHGNYPTHCLNRLFAFSDDRVVSLFTYGENGLKEMAKLNFSQRQEWPIKPEQGHIACTERHLFLQENQSLSAFDTSTLQSVDTQDWSRFQEGARISQSGTYASLVGKQKGTFLLTNLLEQETKMLPALAVIDPSERFYLVKAASQTTVHNLKDHSIVATVSGKLVGFSADGNYLYMKKNNELLAYPLNGIENSR